MAWRCSTWEKTRFFHRRGRRTARIDLIIDGAAVGDVESCAATRRHNYTAVARGGRRMKIDGGQVGRPASRATASSCAL